jgi:rSAM/selenodomain-associated transferase 1
MARAPVPGRCKTRIAAECGVVFAADLCRAMLLDTLANIHQASPESRLVVMATPEDAGVALLRSLAPPPWEVIAQQGDDLGARLAHAFVTLREAGDEQDSPPAVALVDADSPTAPWEDAARAIRTLRGPRRACIGPCEDGGYWLVATTNLELGILEGIAWSTSAVAAQTRERCQTLGIALDEIATAYDVDVASDLDRLREELRADPSKAPRTAALVAQKHVRP